MSDNKDLFDYEEEFKSLFKDLRNKYNLDENGTYKKEESSSFTREKDRELEEFFSSSEKAASKAADNYLSVYSDYEEDQDSYAVDGQKASDYEWDEDTVLDFGDKNPENQKSEKDIPVEFEDIYSKSSDGDAEHVTGRQGGTKDIFSGNSDGDITDSAFVKLKLEQKIREEFLSKKTETAKENDIPQEKTEEEPPVKENVEDIVEKIVEKQMSVVPEKTEEPEKNIEPTYEEYTEFEWASPDGIKFTEDDEYSPDDYEQEETNEQDYTEEEEELTEEPITVTPKVLTGKSADIENTQVINKDITYEDINWDDFPLGKEKIKKVQSSKGKKKKRRRKRTFFPRKGDEPGEIVRKLIIIASLIAIVISGGWLLNDTVIQPILADRLNNKLSDTLVDSKTNKVVDDFGKLNKSDQTLTASKLLEQNKDYIGWLTVKGAGVSLPVVKPADNDKYVRRGYDGNYLFSGTLFVDARVSSMFDRNIVIYGHNMGNGTMFGSLKKYKTSDKNFYKKNKYITFHTIYGTLTYEIFAAYSADGTGEHDNSFIANAVVVNHSNDDFVKYISQVYKKRYCDPGTVVRESDKIITLVTCDKAQWETGRLIVLGKLVSITK